MMELAKFEQQEPAVPGNRPALTTRPGGVTAPTAAEVGGPKGPEPTRYGDWERRGRCIDF